MILFTEADAPENLSPKLTPLASVVQVVASRVMGEARAVVS